MRVTRFLAAAALGLMSTLALADNADQNIRKTLQALQPDLPIDSIASSPLQGLYQVQLKGGRVLYASADGQFVMQGYLYQVKDGKPVNLTEKAESQAIAKAINGVPASEMVVYPAKGQAKAHITVFTDTTCPYCQKLHAEVPDLTEQGIEVRYMAFPRQGPQSAGDKQLQAVWCAKERPRRWTHDERQGNQVFRVQEPGRQAVPDGPDGRGAGNAGDRPRQRPVAPRLPAGQAVGQAGAGGQVAPGLPNN